MNLSKTESATQNMPRRKLGGQGLTVSAVGLGCMGMSWAYGSPAGEAEAQSVFDRAIELGVDFFDTAAIYANGENEQLVGRAIGRRRPQVIMATKFGYAQDDAGNRRLDSSPGAVRRSVEASLKNLETDHIDLLYQHRVDPKVPIEDTIGTVADLVKEGKVQYVGLSEASVTTIQRANAVFPITAVQTEYSIWERGCEEEILKALRVLGIGLVCYSPLGRGFLAAPADTKIELKQGDYRLNDPRFSDENAEKNAEIRRVLEKIGREKNATSAQIAIAWLLAQGTDIIPIPGTKRVTYLEKNIEAAFLRLSEQESRMIAELLPPTAGDRYNATLMKTVNL